MNIEKIARTPDDRMLLSKLWDKIDAGMRRNVPASTCFLSAREADMAQYLFGKEDGLYFYGGYENAERKLLVYLPAYTEPDYLRGEHSPVACLEATWFKQDVLTHRDFLGALIGIGVSRQAIGDICIEPGRATIFVTAEMAPFLLQDFRQAGRTAIRLSAVAPAMAHIPEAKQELRSDTVSSLRLDAVIAAGFRISRTESARSIAAGHAFVNGVPCEKPDTEVSVGAGIAVRGLGKICLKSVGAPTKKGRLPVSIAFYL